METTSRKGRPPMENKPSRTDVRFHLLSTVAYKIDELAESLALTKSEFINQLIQAPEIDEVIDALKERIKARYDSPDAFKAAKEAQANRLEARTKGSHKGQVTKLLNRGRREGDLERLKVLEQERSLHIFATAKLSILVKDSAVDKPLIEEIPIEETTVDKPPIENIPVEEILTPQRLEPEQPKKKKKKQKR